MIRKSFSKKARLRSALIKNLSLIIPKRYTFIAINNYFITLVKGNTYEISTDTSSFPKSLLLHCKQINRVENKVDGQQSSLLTYIQVSDYKAAFTPMLSRTRHTSTSFQSDFKLLNEKATLLFQKNYF